MKKTEPKYRHVITLTAEEEAQVRALNCGIMQVFRAGIEAKKKESRK